MKRLSFKKILALVIARIGIMNMNAGGFISE